MMSFKIKSIYLTKLATLTLLGTWTSTTYAAHPPETGCFARHLSEAIHLNQLRKPIYSKLSQEESEAISDQLIFLERLSYLPAKWMDWKAKKYQKAGIPILCDEFVSMDAVPKFQEVVPPPSSLPLNPTRINTDEIKTEIRKQYKMNGFDGVSHSVERYLEDLNQADPYHCMVKHILESVLRTSKLAPKHHEAALGAKLPSTKDLSWDFIRLQLFALSSGEKLDVQAYSVHSKGIPIICQDVPPIPADTTP